MEDHHARIIIRSPAPCLAADDGAAERRVLGLIVFGLSLGMSITAALAQAVWPTKPVLTLDGARRVAAAATQEARRMGAPCVIAVADDGGHLILLERMDDAPMLASVELAPAKARSAALFRKPTQALEEAIHNGRAAAITAIAAGPVGFVEMTGGVPLLVEGKVVGAVGISAATPANDAQIAAAAVRALEP
jgi:glc operon protein GlcG